MQIQFFIQVMNFLKQIADNGIILEKYKQMETLLRTGLTEPGKDLDNEIVSVKEQLRLILLENDPAELGYSACRLIEKMDQQEVFGKVAADFLSEIPETGIDYRKFASGIAKKVKALNKHIRIISGFFEVFDQVLLAELLGPAEGSLEKPGLYIFFENQVAVKNFKDLEKFTRIWDDIIESFTGLTGGAPHEIEFCTLKDETIILGINTDPRSMEAMIRGTTGIISLIEPIVKIRKIQEEMSHLQLQYDYRSMLEEEMEWFVDNEARKLAGEVYADFRQESNELYSDGIRNLTRALKQVYSFIQKGGKLEYVFLPEDLDSAELNRQLMAAFRSIAGLDGLLKQLEGESDEIKAMLAGDDPENEG